MTPRPPAADSPPDPRDRLTDAWLRGWGEPEDAAEVRVRRTLAAFDAPHVRPATAPRPRRRGRRAVGWAALAACLAAGVTLAAWPTPAGAASAPEVVAKVAAASAQAGPRRFDLVLDAGRGERTGTAVVAGRGRFRVDLDPVRPLGRGLSFGTDGEASWVRGPLGTVRTFDRPAVWSREPGAEEFRVLPGPPAELLARLAEGYDLAVLLPGPGEPAEGVRPVVAERRTGVGPDRVTLWPDPTGTRLAQLELGWDEEVPGRPRRLLLTDAGPAAAVFADATGFGPPR